MLTEHARFARISVCLALALGASGRLAADTNRVRELIAQIRAESLAHPERAVSTNAPEAYGLGQTVVNIHAYAFQGLDSAGDVLADDGNGYRSLVSTTSGGYLAAPVQLPSGASIVYVAINYCIGTTGGFTVGLLDGNTFGQPASLVGGGTISGLPPDCWHTSFTVNYEYAANYQHPLYALIHWEGPLDGSLKFNGLWVAYSLQVSPAPQTATFADVPTGHPFFQFVEALVASGITAGCGNGNFCPDQPLTRGQMAVFLSKALGLDWQN
jgi:hypothetical protein